MIVSKVDAMQSVQNPRTEGFSHPQPQRTSFSEVICMMPIAVSSYAEADPDSPFL